ncbi:MAG: HIRAN domain-containing protein [Bacteroidales bacterium]|nr:HIRAN domain-containing protein [Bacteroidales bacterium]
MKDIVEEKKKEMRTNRHLLNTHIAGFAYWDGAEAFASLQIGTILHLQREESNRFDAYAVAVYYNEYKLGYLPRECNKEISKYLDMGYEDIYEVRVCRLNAAAHTEQQVEIVIKIRQCKSNSKDVDY